MIGVCIKYFHENYGGMLQAYATVSMLEDRGLDYELIQYEKKCTPIGVLKSLPRLLNGVLINDKYEASNGYAGNWIGNSKQSDRYTDRRKKGCLMNIHLSLI